MSNKKDCWELRELAVRILGADCIEDKLYCPPQLSDDQPGPAFRWKEPSRPPGMHFQKRVKEDKLPAFHEHSDHDKRAICLHRFAGHELLAVEIMAYALLAFPEAPSSFRLGLASTLRDEQRHVRLYMQRMEAMGLRFGDLPLYKHFWAHVPYLTNPLRYISTMSLTFEQANLDFAPLYGASFLRHGDKASAQLMETILRDEIGHVRFGWQWLKRLKDPELSEWDTWVHSQSDALNPYRAKGFIINREPRLQAGLPEEWIDRLAVPPPLANGCSLQKSKSTT